MSTGVGAANLGQPPEQEVGDYRVSEEDLRDENLQGSIDVVIEDWKSDDYAWWAATPEGAIALQLMFQVGQKIGEYRARKGQPTPPPNSNLSDLTPVPTEQHTEQAKEEAAAQAEKDRELEELRDEVERLRTGQENEAKVAAQPDPPAEPEAEPDATPAAEIQQGETTPTPEQAEGIAEGTEHETPDSPDEPR